MYAAVARYADEPRLLCLARVAAMLERRHFLAIATASVLVPHLAAAAPPLPAAERLNELGPEARVLAQRVGLWDVTETHWDSRGAAPVVTTGLVAERRMVGSLLQEFLRPPSDAAHAAVARSDLLVFNRLDGRWDYVSFDTRVPVGLMPAWSSDRGTAGTIELVFAPFATTGSGSTVTGQLLRMTQVIRFESLRRDIKDQYFTMADVTGTKWLAHRYAYARRS